MHSGGYDFSLETSAAFEIGSNYELNQISKELRKFAVPIMSVGFHMPGTVWVINDTLYHTFSYRDDFMKTYHSVFELLNYEIQFDYEEVYVTLDGRCPWRWENIRKQNAEVLSMLSGKIPAKRLQELKDRTRW